MHDAVFRYCSFPLLHLSTTLPAKLDSCSNGDEHISPAVGTDLLLNARYAYCGGYAADRQEEDPLSDLICPFFEDIGTYVRRGALPADVVYESFSYSIMHYWKMSEPFIRRIRSDNRSDFYTEFEYLNNIMTEIASEKKVPSDIKSSGIANFQKFEMERILLFRSVPLVHEVESFGGRILSLEKMENLGTPMQACKNCSKGSS